MGPDCFYALALCRLSRNVDFFFPQTVLIDPSGAETLIFIPIIKPELAPSTEQVGDVSDLITAASPPRRRR